MALGLFPTLGLNVFIYTSVSQGLVPTHTAADINRTLSQGLTGVLGTNRLKFISHLEWMNAKMSSCLGPPWTEPCPV